LVVKAASLNALFFFFHPQVFQACSEGAVASFEQQCKVWTVGHDVTETFPETFPETRKPALA